MNKEFVPPSETVELKQLGFAEPCYAYRDSTGYLMIKPTPHCPISAPTYAQAFRFFREKHGLFVQPNATFDSTGTWYYFSIRTKRNDVCEGSFVYEEAELACLRKLIEIVKTKQ